MNHIVVARRRRHRATHAPPDADSAGSTPCAQRSSSHQCVPEPPPITRAPHGRDRARAQSAAAVAAATRCTLMWLMEPAPLGRMGIGAAMAQLVVGTAAALQVLPTGAADVTTTGLWTRGESAALTVFPNGSILLLSSHHYPPAADADYWRASAVSGCGTVNAVASSGRDWLGGFDHLALSPLCGLRYYTGSDAFVFERRVGADGVEPRWPIFNRSVLLHHSSSPPPPPPSEKQACATMMSGTDQTGGVVLRSNDSAASFGYVNETDAGCCGRCVAMLGCSAWVMVGADDPRIPNATCFLVAGVGLGTTKRAGRTVGFVTRAAVLSAGARALSWEPDYMLKGSLLELDAPGVTGRSDGPLMVFGAAPVKRSATNRSSETLVLSALDRFGVHAPAWRRGGTTLAIWMSSDPAGFPDQNKTLLTRVMRPPPGTVLRTALLVRSELKRASLAWGSFVRRFHNTTRSRGSGTSQLSYW
jgi:hypothetical protein